MKDLSGCWVAKVQCRGKWETSGSLVQMRDDGGLTEVVTEVVKTVNETDKCQRGCGEKGTVVYCWWEGSLVQPMWTRVWSILKKVKMQRPFDPGIPLLGIYPKNPETPI